MCRVKNAHDSFFVLCRKKEETTIVIRSRKELPLSVSSFHICHIFLRKAIIEIGFCRLLRIRQAEQHLANTQLQSSQLREQRLQIIIEIVGIRLTQHIGHHMVSKRRLYAKAPAMSYPTQPTPATMYMITEIHRNKIASAKLRISERNAKQKPKFLKLATVPSPSTCRGRPPCLPEQQLTTTTNKQQQNNLPSIAGRHGGLPLHEEGDVSMKRAAWGLHASKGIVSPSGDERGAFGGRKGG